MAVKKEEVPYTSASTAENQKVSEKVYASAPTIAAPMITDVWVVSGAIVLSGTINFFAKCEIVQKRNNIESALVSADNELI